MALRARQKAARRKGGTRERVFGCDLLEHLQQSGQEVPQVLRSCSEFVERHGVVDGIYRLSGVASNIQRLRQEFDAERCPDLQRDIYLQDIHSVSSLCKAYFRELPNPLLTYQLYDKFADAVAIQMEEGRLVKIKEVLKELPLPHHRTLEFLMRHLLRMAAHSSQTNMHARNLAIVWAPNLLRSKDIEASGFNGTAAFMEVRVQSIVVEFILTHVEQLFGDSPLPRSESPRRSLLLGTGVAGVGQAPPYHVPAALSQGDGPPPIRPYHTIIELSEHRRKGSLKAKKWRSIFNLGRSSHEAKRKLPKAEEKEDKGSKLSLRPAKSMDSLSSSPGSEEPRLGRGPAAKQAPQRRESFDTCSSLPPALGSYRELGESLQEPPKGKEEPRGPESEGESSTKSEPTTPRAARASPVPPGCSARAGGGRAERCAGVHISGPFAVTVPFHITSNLSRLTRGLPCPALAQAAAGRAPPAGTPTPIRCPARDPEPPAPRGGAERLPAAADSGAPGGPQALPPPSPSAGDTEGARLSLELRDSFAFLDSPEEPWLEAAGDGEPLAWPLPLGTGPGEGCPAMEEGMESGCMNPAEPWAEPWAEQPGSYLSIEECMEEEMFFMAPGGSDPEDCPRDTDSELFLSAQDELSPLPASPEPLQQPPGEGVAPQTLAQPSAHGATVSRAGAAAAGPAEPCLGGGKDAVGEGEHPWDPSGVPGNGGEGAADGSSSPSGTESSAGAGLGAEAGGAGGQVGLRLVLDTAAGGEEDAASPEAPGEAQPQPAAGVPAASALEEPPGPGCAPGAVPQLGPEAVPKVTPEVIPEVTPEATPEVIPEATPKVIPEVTPKVIPEATPKVIPEVTPEATPEVIPEATPEVIPEVTPEVIPEVTPEATPEVIPEATPEATPEVIPEATPEATPEVIPEATPEAAPEAIPEALPHPAASSEGLCASPGSISAACSSSLELSITALAAPEEPGGRQAGAAGQPGGGRAGGSGAVLRRDGSAQARLAARRVRVQQARSVPVVPPKPQFAKAPPAPQPCPPPGAAERPPGAPARRAGWRDGASLSFDAAVAAAAEQQLRRAPVRRIQTCGGSGEPAAAAPPRALPFHRAPLRLRPLSCVAAAEGEAPAGSRLSLARPLAQDEGVAAVPPLRRAVGTEGVGAER